jgi:cytidylate kinase
VAEGRDIGTVVFPDAPAKFFLTASLEVRAKRRQAELQAKGQAPDLATTMAEVAQRDEQDSQRPIAPLKQADDATLIDSTGRSIEDVVSEMELRAREALG